MNPFDDTLPEEQESKYRELIELLQRARRNPLPGTSAEQAITRVQQRLAELEYTANQTERAALQLGDTGKQFGKSESTEPGTVRSLPADSPGISRAAPRRRRGVRILNVLAAILGVCLLIGASLILFKRPPQSSITTGPAIGPVGTPVTVRTQANGLELSVSVTPGPYFLGELIAVDMSLTNHTHTTYRLYGVPEDIPCFPALFDVLTGGGSPHLTIFDTYFPPMCTHGGWSTLEPGQAISIRNYTALTSSGQQTLTVRLWLDLGTDFRQAFNPFKAHPLLFKLNVVPRVPADRRVLSLQQRGSEVAILAPSSLHHQFAYDYHVDCENAQGIAQIEQGASGFWQPLTTSTLSKPACVGEMPLPHEQWRVAVGAAGYAIVVKDFSA